MARNAMDKMYKPKWEVQIKHSSSETIVNDTCSKPYKEIVQRLKIPLALYPAPHSFPPKADNWVGAAARAQCLQFPFRCGAERTSRSVIVLVIIKTTVPMLIIPVKVLSVFGVITPDVDRAQFHADVILLKLILN
ncbi:unnamed protein product [Leptosia nina]|uniref:Uncharacterized protein n=1 Tax=Leptosia nina TaxID=320188 RepID=A0AAV1JIM0_9NEOP